MSHIGSLKIECPCACAAAGGFTFSTPDTVAHVCIGGIRDTGSAEVADVTLVLFNFRVAILQVQHNRVLIMDIAVAEPVDFESCVLEDFAAAHEIVVIRIFAVCPEDDVLHIHLLSELQVCFAGFR